MRIQVQTDRNVDVSDGMVQRIEGDIESALSRFGDHVTRVEVHLASETSGRTSGDDKRCVIEARLAGRQPVAVTHHASSVGEACSGAVHKLESLIGSRYGRSDSRKGGDSLSHLDVREGLS
ncbi:HPF/RaiA family ribosome-associated protein [Asanoa sp. NPDC049518]|uniref:HPF/RaiA family ribosome-associated protein n=1 Tax=unclassified Asanoa TaxID=2685164 RepID=UPI003435C886